MKAALRTFKVYQSVRKALERQKIYKSGATATLLLEAFIENDGRLLASSVYARGLCEEKQFRDWRKNLVDKGWIIWSEKQDDKGVYSPGKKLIPYINKENIAQKEIATRSSVEKLRMDLGTKIESKADRSELIELKERMAKFEEIARRLEAATGDPITVEKIADQKACAVEMRKLALAN